MGLPRFLVTVAVNCMGSRMVVRDTVLSREPPWVCVDSLWQEWGDQSSSSRHEEQQHQECGSTASVGVAVASFISQCSVSKYFMG